MSFFRIKTFNSLLLLFKCYKSSFKNENRTKYQSCFNTSRDWSARDQWSNTNIKEAEVIFRRDGVLFELSRYLGEESTPQNYSVFDLLYNLPCVHRAFSITYGCAELFIPIRDVKYVVNTGEKKGYIQFLIDERYANGNSLRYVPKQFEKINDTNDTSFFMKKKDGFSWDVHENIKLRLNNISRYHSEVRKDLHYIFGDTRLWY